jgi:hypothetical protein
MTGRRVLRIATLGGVVLLAIAAGLHGAIWWWATAELERRAAAWVAARGAEGIAVRHGPPARGGWPWQARLSLPGVVAVGQHPSGVPVELRAEAVELAVSFVEPRLLRIAVPGAFALDVAPVLAARGRSARLVAEVPLAGGGPSRLLAEALEVDWGSDALAVARLDLTVARDARAAAEMPALAVSLAAVGVRLPAAVPAPLGREVARAEMQVQVVGQVPSGPPRAVAAAWRDAGGHLQLPLLRLDWGPGSLNADATLALDAALQPSGAGRVRIAGAGSALDRLAAGGWVAPQAAQAGRTMAMVLQRSPAGGGPPVVELPLALQDRVLRMGRFVLWHAPELVLP